MTICNNSIPKLLSKMITKVLGTDKYRNLVLVLFVNGLGRLRSNRVSWTLQGPFKILDAFGFVLSADPRSSRFLTECSVLCYPMGDISTPCGKFVRRMPCWLGVNIGKASVLFGYAALQR